MLLRQRLTILYALLLGGILLIFGALVFGLVSITLQDQVDTLLSQQAQALIGVLRVNENGVFDIRPLSKFQPVSSSLLFQVWGADRRLQAARPASLQVPLDEVGRLSRQPVYRTTNSQGMHLRVLSVPLRSTRGSVGVLQVAVSLSLIDSAQQAMISVSLSLALVAMLAGGLMASLVTGRALARLETVTQVATTITRADDLSRRIPQTGSVTDEVGQLIQAFNQTLTRLEDLFNTQRRFVADVSHELRTPLTVMKGELGLLRRMGNVDEESLSSIETEVDRLTRLVGDLLLLAQAESGRLPLDLRPVELDTILLEVFNQVRTLAGERVQVRLTGIDQVLLVGDRDRLKQVLLNLASNAVQYTPQGGTVTLSLEKTDTQARVIISDTGSGIPAADLPHIFERFYRGEKSRRRGQGSGGFGLGLSIAYWIVRNHHGTIEVRSKEGQGSTFCVWLPLKPPESSS